MAAQKNRDLSLDAFRGIAMIAVVAIHAIYLGGSPYDTGFLYYRQLLNFAVPVLFFISGYWSSREQIVSLEGYKTFLSRRLSRILIPYLFWSSVLLGYSAIKAHYFDGTKIIFTLLTGGACTGYYFIIVLAQLYILTPLLQYINRKLNVYGLVLVTVFSIAVLFVLYLSRVFNVIWHLPIGLPFYSWIIFYEIGIFMAGRNNEVSVRLKTQLFILFVILLSLAVSMLEANILLTRYNNPRSATFNVKYSTYIYSVCVILIFIFNRKYFARMPKILSVIGYYSLGIYLIHLIILEQVVNVFKRFDTVCSFQPLYQLVLVATTLSICLILISNARKLFPEFLCSKILGF
jgi:surface polysaccharide O-acyltransferase-like enzyme